MPFGNQEVNRCPRCNQAVFHAEAIPAAGKQWHKTCYRCGSLLDAFERPRTDFAFQVCVRRCWNRRPWPNTKETSSANNVTDANSVFVALASVWALVHSAWTRAIDLETLNHSRRPSLSVLNKFRNEFSSLSLSVAEINRTTPCHRALRERTTNLRSKWSNK